MSSFENDIKIDTNNVAEILISLHRGSNSEQGVKNSSNKRRCFRINTSANTEILIGSDDEPSNLHGRNDEYVSRKRVKTSHSEPEITTGEMMGYMSVNDISHGKPPALVRGNTVDNRRCGTIGDTFTLDNRKQSSEISWKPNSEHVFSHGRSSRTQPIDISSNNNAIYQRSPGLIHMTSQNSSDLLAAASLSRVVEEKNKYSNSQNPNHFSMFSSASSRIYGSESSQLQRTKSIRPHLSQPEVEIPQLQRTKSIRPHLSQPVLFPSTSRIPIAQHLPFEHNRTSVEDAFNSTKVSVTNESVDGGLFTSYENSTDSKGNVRCRRSEIHMQPKCYGRKSPYQSKLSKNISQHGINLLNLFYTQNLTGNEEILRQRFFRKEDGELTAKRKLLSFIIDVHYFGGKVNRISPVVVTVLGNINIIDGFFKFVQAAKETKDSNCSADFYKQSVTILKDAYKTEHGPVVECLRLLHTLSKFIDKVIDVYRK